MFACVLVGAICGFSNINNRKHIPLNKVNIFSRNGLKYGIDLYGISTSQKRLASDIGRNDFRQIWFGHYLIAVSSNHDISGFNIESGSSPRVFNKSRKAEFIMDGIKTTNGERFFGKIWPISVGERPRGNINTSFQSLFLVPEKNPVDNQGEKNADINFFGQWKFFNRFPNIFTQFYEIFHVYLAFIIMSIGWVCGVQAWSLGKKDNVLCLFWWAAFLGIVILGASCLF